MNPASWSPDQLQAAATVAAIAAVLIAGTWLASVVVSVLDRRAGRVRS